MSDVGRPWDRTANAAALFAGDRLTLARHLAGLRKSELAVMVNKSGTAVTGWESGAKRPTPATLAQLALSLGVEPSFFAVRPDDVAATSSTPHFRSLRSTTQVVRDQAYSYGQLCVDIAQALERHVELPERDIPAFPVDVNDTSGDAPEAAARFIRSRWGLEAGPLGHSVRLLERHGVLVVFSPPQTSTVDAFSFDSRLRPIVVLNPIKRDYYRQRFDVAHELGHLVMHADAEPGGRVAEDQAHRFAAEFLMPAENIRPLLPRSMNGAAWASLGRLKEQWGVSIQALLYRGRRLGCLSGITYRNAMVTISNRGWRRDEPGLINSIERPSLLPKAVELLAGIGIDEATLVEQCRVPVGLFRAVTARSPDVLVLGDSEASNKVGDPYSKVVSLLRWREGDRQAAGTSE